MGIHSGVFGAVDGQSTVFNWSIGETSDAQSFVASNTKGGTGRRAGNVDWTGSFQTYGGLPTVMPGEEFTFTGYTAPTNDVRGTVGNSYEGTAIVESLAINWDFAAGGLIKYTTNFAAGSGPLVIGTDTVEDTTAPTALSSLESKIEWGSDIAVPVWTDWLCWTQAALTINAANPTTSASCGGGHVSRKAGPIDWTLAITQEEDGRSPVALHGIYGLRLYIDATTFWLLDSGICTSFDNVNVDVEGGSIINQQVNFGMYAEGNTAIAGLGSIALPGGAVYWPIP